MTYFKTVLVAIGICMLVLFLRGALDAAFAVRRGRATGVAFVWRGVVEFFFASVVLGWVSGTAWFMVRRLLTRASG